MKKDLEKYVGRIVRLNQQTFRKILSPTKYRGVVFDNCFVVADVSRRMHKLICYGGDFRIIVGASDVVLI